MLALPTMLLGIAKLGNGGSSNCMLVAVTVTTIWQRASQVGVHGGAPQTLSTTLHTVARALRVTVAGSQAMLCVAIVSAWLLRASKVL